VEDGELTLLQMATPYDTAAVSGNYKTPQ